MLHRPITQHFTALTFLRDVGLGLLLWVLLTFVVGESRLVPTGSMEPTVRAGNRIWTDKITLRFGPLQRGDIVVFDPPVQTESQYLKRVVGLPGETVEVRDGKVWVNGEALDEPYIMDEPAYRYGPVTVPAGYYLVLGDNRNVSHDSHNFGPIRREWISARAVYRLWPLADVARIAP
ncbi:MAG TPA: signal peptidase I [Symbiobacteriaceae bacterium]|nr:signal peptidase I [Symbiobacteriaceae bacterium]